MAALPLAAPAVAAAALPAPLAFDLHHDGRPDLTDPVVVSALAANLRVQLTDLDRGLIKATPCLKWQPVPGAAPADPPIAMSFLQEDLDLLTVAGGISTDWLAGRPNSLLVSHSPAHANDMFLAWVGSGNLDLSITYRSMPQLVDAVVAAKVCCGKDNRLLLEEKAFFANEDRPATGGGSAVDRSWMYAFEGMFLVGDDVMETRALAYLQKAVSNKAQSAGRDLAGDNYCRILQSLRRIASFRSPWVEQSLSDPDTPNEEIAEYVADLWKQLVVTGYPFQLEGRLAQRNKEIGLADSLLHGKDGDRETAFQSMLPALVSDSMLVAKCIRDGSGMQSTHSLEANFEQLATFMLPGVKWSTADCLRAVEHELAKAKLETLILSWGNSPLDVLSNLRAHIRHEESAVESTIKSSEASEGADRGLNSASGIDAKKMPAFLDTLKRVKRCTNFLSVLDTLLDTASKPWYMKGIRKMLLASQNTVEMESCSGLLEEWAMYWPMAISRDEQDIVEEDVQGKSFPEEEVNLLLDGKWDKVDWVRLLQLLELWKDRVQPGEGTFIGNFATLTGVKELLFNTMRLLKLARVGESGDALTTCTGFMNKILRLERRSQSLPKGTPARRRAVDNVVAVFKQGLKEFGHRWAKQWTKPVNYTEPLITSFADKHCFVMLRFEKLDQVADNLHDIADVLPVLFEGGTFKSETEIAPMQRPNSTGEESLARGDSTRE